MRLVKLDIEKGEFTFGQKIKLNQLLMSDVSEIEKVKGVIRILGGKIKRITRWNAKKVLKYVNEVVKGLEKWAEKEKTALKYEPTADEKKQGFNVVYEKFCEFATSDALAEKYHIDPDTILEWKYAKIFLILAKDLEVHKITMRNYEREKNKK